MHSSRSVFLTILVVAGAWSGCLGDRGPGGSDGGSPGGSGADAGNGGPGDRADAGPPGPATGDCDDQPVCDDFEAAVPGGPPDPGLWAVVSPNCSGSGSLVVDGNVAHSGNNSVRIDGGGGYCDHVFLATSAALPVIGRRVFGRFFVRMSQPLGAGHVTFVALKDSSENKDLRMGGQNQILMWNRESDDATLPELSPTGTQASVQIAANQWVCIELEVNGEAGTIKTWVNGDEVAGLIVDGTPTPDIDAQWLRKANWRPTLVDAKFGWEGYSGQSNTLWFDDVALGSARIGCGR